MFVVYASMLKDSVDLNLNATLLVPCLRKRINAHKILVANILTKAYLE